MMTDPTRHSCARFPWRASKRAYGSAYAALALALAVAVSHGQTWDGGAAPNGNWSAGANWAGSAPVSDATTDLIFAGGTQLAATNDIASPFLLHDLTFDGTAGAFLLSGSPLQLYGGVTNHSASLQTIGNNVTLAAHNAWNAASGNIALTGNLTGPTYNLTKDGGQVLRLQGATSIADLNIAAGTLLLSGGTFANTWGTSADLFTGTGSALVVTNGAKFLVGTTTVGLLADFGQDGCEVAVVGAGSAWIHGKGIINMSSSECTLRVGDGGVVGNADRLYIGYNSTRGLNRVVIFDGGLISNINATVAAYIGSGGTSLSNSVTVAGTNASGVRATWDLKNYLLSVGATSSDYNTLTIGQGGQVLRAKITIGSSDGGEFNTLIVTNGGRVVSSGTTHIGGTAGAAHNCGWIGGADPVTGEPTYYSVGGTLLVGYGTRSHDNRLTITDGAVVTNIVGTGTGFIVGGSGAASNNAAVVSGGAKVYCSALTVGDSLAACGNSLRLGGGSLWSTGSLDVGSGSRAVSNELVVTGNGYCNLAAQSLFVGSGQDASGNSLLIADGGAITNTGNSANLWVGSGARAHGNRLIVSGSGRLHLRPAAVDVGCSTTTSSGGNLNLLELGAGTISSSDDSQIGYGSHTNTVYLYGGATWQAGDGASDDLSVGSTNSVASGSAGTGNSLRVGRGGTANVGGSLFVGDASSTGNRVELEGGSVSAANATVYAGNELAVRIDSLGLTAMVVSGTATLEAGTRLRPSAATGAPYGTYAVLTAGALVDNGIELDPSASDEWILSVANNTLYLTYGTTGGVAIDDDGSLVWESLATASPVTFAFAANGIVTGSPTRMAVLVSETVAATPITVTGTVTAAETAGVVTGVVAIDAADLGTYDTLFFRGFRY